VIPTIDETNGWWLELPAMTMITTKNHTPHSALRRRGLQLLSVFALSVGATVLSTASNALAAPAVCPARSQGDHAFRMADIGECIWVNNDHNLKPRLGEFVDYNIYCPGRIPTTGWEKVGRAIANGTTNIKSQDGHVMNPITQQHAAGRLKAEFASMPHVYHYGCVNGGTNGVATHIKVRVRAMPLEPNPGSCKAFGSQNGDIALNARMDREYRCDSPMFHNSDRGGFGSRVKTAAIALLRQEDTARAAKLGGKICLLPETDIQCAPCTFSDKLIVRVLTVPQAASCPAGSREVR
jgi:hypothetical protein